MNRRTLLDRDLEVAWLDAALRIAREPGISRAERLRRLEFALRDVPLAEEARKKTVTALARSWFGGSTDADDVTSWAVDNAHELLDTRVAHIGVLLATQPFFADVCRSVGRVLSFEDVVTTPELRHRMKDVWGQRRSVDRAAQRALKTLRALRCVTGGTGMSVSRRGEPITPDGPWVPWLVHALLVARDAESLGDVDVRSAPELFAIAWPASFPNDYPYLERHTEGGGRLVYARRPLVRAG